MKNSEVSMSACLDGLVWRGFKPKVIFDIGAAIGSWSRRVAKLWSNTEIHMFEPLSERKDRLIETCNDFPSRVYYHSLALSDHRGLANFGVNKNNLFISSLLYENPVHQGKVGSPRKVQLDTLDRMYAEGLIPQPNFIKIDVQGAQMLVLMGAKKVLQNTDLVLLEVPMYKFSPKHWVLLDYVKWMDKFDFVMYEIVDVLRRPFDGAMGQIDVLFCKKDHFLYSKNEWNSQPYQNKIFSFTK